MEDGNIPLEDIDFIISTFHLTNLKVPVLKINPIITEKDIAMIKNYIYKEDYNPISYTLTETSYILDSLMSIVNKYINSNDEYNLRNELSQVLEFILNNTSQSNFSKEIGLYKIIEEIGLIMLDIGQLLEDLKEYIDEQNFILQIWGLVIHIVMAIPRWKNRQNHGDYTRNELTLKEEKIYKLVSDYIDNVAVKHNLFISESEKVSIVKYFV